MTEFERETCSRCGGSGEHSYNPRDGYVCFKCGGRCVTLTKKGKATAEHDGARQRLWLYLCAEHGFEIEWEDRS